MANKIGLWSAVVAALAFAVPLALSAGRALSPGEPANLLVDLNDHSCLTRWYIPDDHAELLSGVEGGAEPEQLQKWRREGAIAHAGSLQAAVSVHGNPGSSVEIRDVSITVTGRAKPKPGTVTGPLGCGGGPERPSYLAVDLDTLPLNRSVPAAYLLRSERQRAARQLEADIGQSLTLPRTVAAGDFFTFNLIGMTRSADTHWRATITWWDGEKVQRHKISDGGEDLWLVPTGDDFP